VASRESAKETLISSLYKLKIVKDGLFEAGIKPQTLWKKSG